jgi:hypothetical protein
VTPHYPRNYPNNIDCKIKIRAHTFQTWKIEALDVYLPTVSKTGCGDKMYISDSTKSLTFCGNRFNERIFTTYNNNTGIEVHFTSNATGQMKGAWLYFEGKRTDWLKETDSSFVESCVFSGLLLRQTSKHHGLYICHSQIWPFYLQHVGKKSNQK